MKRVLWWFFLVFEGGLAAINITIDNEFNIFIGGMLIVGILLSILDTYFEIRE